MMTACLLLAAKLIADGRLRLRRGCSLKDGFLGDPTLMLKEQVDSLSLDIVLTIS